MEKKYWLRRKQASAAMARNATSAEARLIHYELAGRYSIRAAHCDRPFLLNGPSSDAEQAALGMTGS